MDTQAYEIILVYTHQDGNIYYDIVYMYRHDILHIYHYIVVTIETNSTYK